MEKHPHANWQLLAVLLGAPAVSYSSLLFRAKLSALPPWFAEISPEPAAPAAPQDRVLTPATPHNEPGKPGPKTKAQQAARQSYSITNFLTKRPDAATSSSISEAASDAASAAQHEDKRPNSDASASATSSSVAEPNLTTTAPPKTKGGFKTGSKLCPGVSGVAHAVRTRRDYRAKYVCA
jgi:hypothetical protein